MSAVLTTLQAGRRVPRSGRLRGEKNETKGVYVFPLFQNESACKTLPHENEFDLY